MTNSYTNPYERLDNSYVEAQVTKGKKYYDEQGWEISPPISDRECIRICLHNSINLCGVDKEQVKKLYIKYGGKEVI